jgi:germination protein YpeB
MYRVGKQGEAKKSAEEAVNAAAAFLRKRNFPAMHESYHIQHDGILTVNFAATQDGVILYPDLVKVSVSLVDGSIAGFEAGGYIMNHMTRDISPATVSVGQARAQVASSLRVLSHKMAVIPTGKNEVFCHEFICEDANGIHCIVYVNATTGVQEKILLLIEDESGTLAM